MNVGVLDYDAGNLTSVSRALEALSADYTVSKDPEILKNCHRLLFPGVGEASYAMNVLRKRGLDIFLNEYIESGRPVFGICLGCQIILDYSQEGNTDCLGLLPGKSLRFPTDLNIKIPHMGWNDLSIKQKNHPLFTGIPRHASYYFVHSYYPSIDPKYTLAESEYGVSFSAAFAKNNLCAVQFHPEKSGKWGLRMMQNFLEWDPESDR